MKTGKYSTRCWSFHKIFEKELIHYDYVCLSVQLKQDCLLQGQAQLDQRVVFRFCTLRLRGGGGVSVDKSENHGLKIHFKSFQAILDNVVFLCIPLPPNLPEGGGVLSINKNENHGLKNFNKYCYFTPHPPPSSGRLGGRGMDKKQHYLKWLEMT